MRENVEFSERCGHGKCFHILEIQPERPTPTHACMTVLHEMFILHLVTQMGTPFTTTYLQSFTKLTDRQTCTHTTHIQIKSKCMHIFVHTGAQSRCLILTPSYLLIGKVDRRREGWVKAHLVINSRSETKTHFMDQCLHSFLPVWYAHVSAWQSCVSQAVSLTMSCWKASLLTSVYSSTRSKKVRGELRAELLSDWQN